MISARKIYAVITVGAIVGFLASFLQMLEKITLLKNSDAVLSCNLNSVFSCPNVLNASQSSVFGFPNSLLCIAFFASMFSVGLIGLTGAAINRWVRLAYQAMSLFFLGFGLWYFWQSIFNIGVVCIYCVFCFSGLLLINWGWLRLNYKNYGLRKRNLAIVERWIDRGADIFLWCLIALLIVLWAIIKF